MTEAEARLNEDGTGQNSWKAFLFVLPFIKPYFRRLLLCSLLDISVSLINLSIPWLGKNIVDYGFPSRDWEHVFRIALWIAGLTALVYLLVGLRAFMYQSTEMLLGLSLRNRMYRHLQRLSLTTTDSKSVGELQFRMITDVDRITHMLIRILPTLTMLVEFTLILIAAISVDPILTGIVLAFLVPWTIMFVWVTLYGRLFDRRRLRYTELRDRGVIQAARSFATIKGFGRTRLERHRNASANIAVQRVSIQGYLILIWFEFTTLKLLPYLKSTTIYLYLARRVVFGEMTLGMTVPMIAYLSRLAFPIERIVNFGCWIWQTMVSAERMKHILTTEPSIQDAPDAKAAGEVQGNIELAGVSCSQPHVGTVIHNLDLSITSGQFVGIVGPSGAGKSTLLSVLLRLIEPDSGTVILDRQDVRTLKRNSWVRQFGVVTQETFIFGGTLRENLLIAKPDATDEELQRVISRAELDVWVSGLPDGIDQDLEGGLGLSAGQMQRVGIARALLCDPKVLLLDEPTSALDSTTETQIMKTLLKLKGGPTIVLVTHRLKTVEEADSIVVLEQGRLVQQGTHSQLASQAGVYRTMMNAHDDLPTLTVGGKN